MKISELKSTKDVKSYCQIKKIKKGIIPYKGGYGVIIDGRVKEIFVGDNANKNALKRLIEIK